MEIISAILTYLVPLLLGIFALVSSIFAYKEDEPAIAAFSVFLLVIALLSARSM